MLILGCLLIVALPWASHWYLLGGGTETAAVDAKAGGQMVEAVFFIELGFLDGRAKMGDAPVRSLVRY